MRSLMIIALSLVACTAAPPADGTAVQTIVAPLFPTPPLVTVGPAAAIAASTTASYNGWGWNVAAPGAAVRYPVALPRGAKLTGWQLYMQRGIEAATTSARLQCQDATGTHSDVGPVVQRIDSATGAISLDAVFSATVDPACVNYSVLVSGCGACADTATGLAVYGAVRRKLSLSPASFSANTGGVAAVSALPMRVSSTQSATFFMTIPLSVGDRLTDIEFFHAGDGDADIVNAAVVMVDATGVDHPLAATFVVNPSAWASTTIGVSAPPLAERQSVVFYASTNGAPVQLGTVVASYDPASA